MQQATREEQLKMSTNQAVNYVRSLLGCGLREAYDFVMRGRDTWVTRLEAVHVDHRQGRYYDSPEMKIRDLMKAYYANESTEPDLNAVRERLVAEIGHALGMGPIKNPRES